MATIRKHIIRTVQDYTRTTRLTHEKKLHALGVRSHIEPCNPERVIFNYSSVNIPTRVRLLLAFGQDFGLPIFKLDYVKYFFSFEKLAYKLKKVSNNVDHAAACKGLKHLAHKYFYNFKSSKIFSIFSKNDIEILKDFSKIDNIIVSKPDKGRGVVVVDKDHYTEGLKKMLLNGTKFEVIPE